MLAHSWHDARIDEIRSPQAWLVTTTTRLCIDRLKQLRADQTDFPQAPTAGVCSTYTSS